MSQASLDADFASLERMVVEYTLDNPGSLDSLVAHPSSSSSSTSGPVSIASTSSVSSSVSSVPTPPPTETELIETLKAQIKQGNIQTIMQQHEQNLHHPILTLVNGQMLRNLLIQIQKLKVDGSVAMHGIDKILKSQELVFGFVAASPAFVVLWYAGGIVRGLIRGSGNGLRGMLGLGGIRESKVEVLKSLNCVERLIDLRLIAISESKASGNITDGVDGGVVEISKDYHTEGLLYLELMNLKKLGLLILPLNLRSNWISDLNDLNCFDYRLKKLTLNRLWNTYGYYFR
ncbi:unnamed protein product [Ambrosiozyma monospora]|uniref:Unnamed protein product n=1 Tax=Ambrosiozyma monospora TaxID=43982 RepID=A0ACB5SWK9_AMBMO|nr:unnamed protein product [Ambrosiozyma monospora]